MNPKAENSSAERRAKLSQQTAPRKSEKNSRGQTVLQTVGVDFAQVSPKSEKFTDLGRRFEFERGQIKYTKAVNVFGLVTKS